MSEPDFHKYRIPKPQGIIIADSGKCHPESDIESARGSSRLCSHFQDDSGAAALRLHPDRHTDECFVCAVTAIVGRAALCVQRDTTRRADGWRSRTQIGSNSPGLLDNDVLFSREPVDSPSGHGIVFPDAAAVFGASSSPIVFQYTTGRGNSRSVVRHFDLPNAGYSLPNGGARLLTISSDIAAGLRHSQGASNNAIMRSDERNTVLPKDAPRV